MAEDYKAIKLGIEHNTRVSPLKLLISLNYQFCAFSFKIPGYCK